MPKFKNVGDYISRIESIYKDETEIEIETDLNEELVKFYGILKIEKMARFPIIGKMDFYIDFIVANLKQSNLYSFSFDISYKCSNISTSHIRSIMDEIDQLEDGKCNISVTFEKERMNIIFKVNAEDIKDLEPAAKATAKFNL